MEALGRGGAERALVTLLPALENLGHSCEVAVLLPPFTLEPDLRELGVPVHHLRLRHRWDLWRGVTGLIALARRGRFDILHAHLFFPSLYVSVARPFALDPARLVTFHNMGYEAYPAVDIYHKARKQLEAVMMRSLDRQLAVSKAVGDHYRVHLGLQHVDVVPNGFDVTAIISRRASRNDVLRDLGLDPDRPILVAVGRLVAEKGYSDLIAALERVHARGCRAQLVVVGGGPLRGVIEQVVHAAGLGDDVLLVGERTHDETLDVVAAADLFVSSSHHEGFPLAPAEAMLLGRPVTLTSAGGVVELVGPQGVAQLVQPGRPGDLAEAILEMLADPDLAADRGEAGRRRVTEQFGIERVARQLESVYQAALASRRKGT